MEILEYGGLILFFDEHKGDGGDKYWLIILIY